ncbi:unnamed protein product [Arabidopsis thaliana]|nr:unnamed protein product [Arabidopsis thaliana]
MEEPTVKEEDIIHNQTSTKEMYDAEKPRCLLSHPADSPHNLSVGCDPKLPLGCFTCGGKTTVRRQDYLHFHCTTCDVKFHEGCQTRPRRITHPYHLQHPLTLFYRNPETGIISNIIPYSSPYESDTSDPESNSSGEGKSELVDIIPSKSDIIFDKCTWCGKDFKGDVWFYRCLICGFCLDLSCALTLPPLTIANPKSHHHSLLFLPRPLLVPCDACGLVNALEPSYACFQCNYMIHQNCIDLPRVIKITRHHHRLSFTPFGPPLISLCRVCYKEVDIKYGQYSCQHEDCSYVAHSKCATHKNVWDGTELEWETEESDENEDIAPFKVVGEDLIKHFCHKHHLRLKKHDGFREAEKQCRACVFPIVSHQFYHCKICNYSLHEVCAGLPRKLDHALHKHRLVLDPSPLHDYRNMHCSTCSRAFTGFRYKCSEKICQDRTNLNIDVSCILVPEYFTHKSHEHPVVISTSYSDTDEILCNACQGTCWQPHIKCTKCDFAMCYTCATIPNEVHYKFDEHPLTLCHGESRKSKYWCEVCEKKLDTTKWFYTCNKCCTTVHRECLFGSTVYMQPGSRFNYVYGTVEVFRNSHNSRLVCRKCFHSCTDSVYFRGYKSQQTFISYKGYEQHEMAICSLTCLKLEMLFW